MSYRTDPDPEDYEITSWWTDLKSRMSNIKSGLLLLLMYATSPLWSPVFLIDYLGSSKGKSSTLLKRYFYEGQYYDWSNHWANFVGACTLIIVGLIATIVFLVSSFPSKSKTSITNECVQEVHQTYKELNDT